MRWTWRKASDNVVVSDLWGLVDLNMFVLILPRVDVLLFWDHFDTNTCPFPLGSQKPRSCMSNHASQAWPTTLDLLTDMLSRQVARVGVHIWDRSSLGLMNQTMVTIWNHVYVVDTISQVLRPKLIVFYRCLYFWSTTIFRLASRDIVDCEGFRSY